MSAHGGSVAGGAIGRVRAALGRRVRAAAARITADDPAAVGSTPLAAGEAGYAIAAPPEPSAGATPPQDPAARPVPPVDLWELPDEHDAGVYLRSGDEHSRELVAVLGRHGVDPAPDAVLDFGCGYGRVTRWLPSVLPGAAVWGVDVDAEAIEWARRNLAELDGIAGLSACTTQPHLPFGDGTFDLVHATSVLPHIADLADGWMLELRRVTRPGGVLYLTVYDDHTAERVRSGAASPTLRPALAAAEAEHGRLGVEIDVLALSRRPGAAQVFRSRRWIERVWGAWFEIVGFEPEAFHIQTAVLLRRHA